MLVVSILHAFSEWWCEKWVGHDCEGGSVDRIICRCPSQPWFVRLSDWLRRNDP